MVKAAVAELESTVDVFNFHFSLTDIYYPTAAAARKLASMIPLKPQDTHTSVLHSGCYEPGQDLLTLVYKSAITFRGHCSGVRSWYWQQSACQSQ